MAHKTENQLQQVSAFITLDRERRAYVPENVIYADNTMRSAGPAVVNDGGIALHPHPATVFGQEAVIPRGHLTFQEHCGRKSVVSKSVRFILHINK